MYICIILKLYFIFFQYYSADCYLGYCYPVEITSCALAKVEVKAEAGKPTILVLVTVVTV